MTNFLPLLLALAALVALGVAYQLRRLRRYHAWWEAEYAAARQVQKTVLAHLSSGEPPPPDVDLSFPVEHPATGAPDVPVRPEDFFAGLAAGPYGYPATLVAYLPQGTWARSNDDPPVAQQTCVLATGRSVDVLTRRRGARWEVAVVTPLSADRGAGV